ncbi:MAG: hypothetical protein V4503_05320 [Gemmatimonadota bacterium]
MSTASRGTGMVLGVGLMLVGLLFVVWAIEEPGRRGFEYFLAALAGGGAVFGVALRGPMGRALGRLIEGDASTDEQLAERVEELEARLANMEQRNLTSGEVEAQFSRLAEVEERLDFAERLLTKGVPQASERSE